MTLEIVKHLIAPRKTMKSTFKGYEISIYPDPAPINPRLLDPIGVIASWDSRVGDVHPNCDKSMYQARISNCFSLPLYINLTAKGLIQTEPSQSIFTCKHIGYIYADASALDDIFFWKRLTPVRRKLIRTYLNSQVSLYNFYLLNGFYNVEVYKRNRLILRKRFCLDPQRSLQKYKELINQGKL